MSPSQSLMPSPASTDEQVSPTDTVSFLHARPRLVGIARRVLGSAAEADDVVQEAWIRWQQSDRSVVRDPTAFLATTTTRLALNVGQSARARHETDFGPNPDDFVDTTADPVRSAERDEAVERALATVLQTLSPPEQAVYLLREAFEYPHRRIAEIVGLSEANVRQLMTRGRRRVGGEARRDLDSTRHRQLVGAFRAAAHEGNLAELESTVGGNLEEAQHVRLAA